MGNSCNPGSVVVGERDHESFDVDGTGYMVRELVWNQIDGRSYDVVRVHDDEVLTDESFDHYPSVEEIRSVIDRLRVSAPETIQIGRLSEHSAEAERS